MNNLLKLSVLFFCVLIFNTSVSSTLYFRGHPTDYTQNKFTDKKCWTANPLESYNGISQPLNAPSSTDDVVFDANSFPASPTVIINGTSTCRDLTFLPSVPTGSEIIGNEELNIYGNFSFPKHAGNSDPLVTAALGYRRGFKNWTGVVNFKAPTGSSVTYNPNGLFFNNNNFYFLTTATYTISSAFFLVDNLFNNYGFYGINVGSGVNAAIINFNDTLYTTKFNILSGTINLNGLFKMPIPSYYSFSTYSDVGETPTININNKSEIDAIISLSKGSTLNVNTNASITHRWQRLYIANQAVLNTNLQPSTTIDFKPNTFIRIDNISTFNAGLSTLNLYSSDETLTGSQGYVANYSNTHFHVVNVHEPYPIKFILTQGCTSFDTLIVKENASIDWQESNSCTEITPNGLLEVNAGSKINFFYRQHSIADYSAINLGANSMLKINGQCNNFSTIENGKFIFSPTTSVSGNYGYIYSSLITGAGAPYNPGGSSVVLGNSVGWAIPPIASNVYYWAGDVPINTNDTSSYADWHVASNWSLNAIANPGDAPTANTCLPTSLDSVVFLNNSYCKITAIEAICKSMYWQGDGALSGVSDTSEKRNPYYFPDPSNSIVRKLNIYGSLHFGAQTKNFFYGDVLFRTWESYPTITSNGVKFNRRIIFNGLPIADGNVKAKWTLNDSLVALKQMQTLHTVVNMNGHLYTNNYPCYFASWSIGSYGDFLYGAYYNNPRKDTATLSLGSSKIHLTRRKFKDYNLPAMQNVYKLEVNAPVSHPGGGTVRLNAGNSEIIFEELTQQGIPNLCNSQKFDYSYIFGTHTFYDFTFKDDTLENKVNFTQSNSSFHDMKFYGTANLQLAASNLNIYRLYTNAVYPNDPVSSINDAYYTYPFPTGNSSSVTIDSAAYLRGNFNFNTNVTYNTLLHLSPGKIYAHNTLVAPPGQTNYLNTIEQTFGNNARLNANGLCTLPIIINGGRFKSLNTSSQTVDYCLINSDTATTANFLYTNSLAANSPGWTGSNPLSRILHWKDNTAGNSKGEWNDPINWQESTTKIPPYSWGPIGECPPSPVDTVIFDDNSFSNTEDTVSINLISGIANCHTMWWNNSASYNPYFKGATNERLHVFGALRFSPTMQQNFMGDVTFRGTSLIDTIRSNGQEFKRFLYFNADLPNVQWVLADSITANANHNQADFINYINSDNNGFTARLIQGTFNSNNQVVRFASFRSEGNKQRKIVLGSSKLYFIGGSSIPYVPGYNSSYYVNGSNLLVSAKNADFIFSDAGSRRSGFAGGGFHYKSVTFNDYYDDWGNFNVNTIGFTPSDTIDVITAPSVWIAGSYNTIANGRTDYKIGKIKILPRVYNGTSLRIYGNNQIDTLDVPCNILVTDSNTYRKQFKLYPSYKYEFGSEKVQYFSNACETNLLGTGGTGEINVYSSNINSKAYFRKDSGTFCADFINIQSIHAIGNGGNYTTPSLSYANILVDTILNSSIYTGATQIPSGAGVGSLNPSISGRAKFLGGSNAKLLTSTPEAKGWDLSPYVIAPPVALSLSKHDICPGDSVRSIISLSGYNGKEFPIIVYYSINGITKTSLFIDNLHAKDTTYIKPTGAYAAVSLDSIEINQCFNNRAILTIKDTIKVHEAPIALVLIANPNDTVCSGTSVTLSATSTATTYGGVATQYNLFNDTTLVSLGTLPYTYTATVDSTFYVNAQNSLGCKSGKVPIAIIVKPLPVLTVIPSKTICSGDTVDLQFSTVPVGSTYTWTAISSNVQCTGYSNTGAGNIQDTLYNQTTSNQTVTYTITPHLNGCTGANLTVVVTVHPAPKVTSIARDTVCSGSLFTYYPTANVAVGVNPSYIWTSPTYNSNSITGDAASGQDSISQTLSLPLNQTTADSVLYYIKAVDQYGCIGKDSMPLTTIVNPIPHNNLTLLSDTICSGGTLQIRDSMSVSGTGSISWTVVSNPSAGITGYSNGTGALVGLNNGVGAISQNIVNTSGGSAVLTYYITPTVKGCTGQTDSIKALVIPGSVIITNARDTAICSGNSITIAPTSNVSNATYTWQIQAPTGITGNSVDGTYSTITDVLSLNVDSLSPKTVLYMITPLTSVCSGTQDTFRVVVKPNPQLRQALTDSVCEQSPYQLTLQSGIIGTSYSWTSTTLTPNIVVYDSTIATNQTQLKDTFDIVSTPLQTSVVQYYITSKVNGCSGVVDTFNLTVLPKPSNVITVVNDTVCSGQSIVIIDSLVSSISGTLTWSVSELTGNSQLSGYANSTSPHNLPYSINQTLINAGNNGGIIEYILASESKGCLSDRDTVYIAVIGIKDTLLVDSNYICSGSTVILSPQVHFPVSVNAYDWGLWNNLANINLGGVDTTQFIINNGLSLQNTLSIIHPIDIAQQRPQTIVYIARPIGNMGCYNFEAKEVVIVNPKPKAMYSVNPLQGTTNTIYSYSDSSIGATSWMWEYGDTKTSTLQNPYHQYDKNGDYKVTLTVSNVYGCVDSINNITIKVRDSLLIPNVFTPNEDGINDLFPIITGDVDEFDLKIYDRWGLLIFDSEGKKVSWDGKSVAGVPATAGTYYYIINLTTTDKKQNTYKGALQLIR